MLNKQLWTDDESSLSIFICKMKRRAPCHAKGCFENISKILSTEYTCLQELAFTQIIIGERKRQTRNKLMDIKGEEGEGMGEISDGD